MINKIQVIKDTNNRYRGELWINGRIVVTVSKANKSSAIRGMNEAISNHERLKQIKLPRIKEDGAIVCFTLEDGTSTVVPMMTPTAEKSEQHPTVCDTPQFNKAQRDIQDSPAPQPTAEALQDKPSETAIQDNAQAKSRKVPKRKPFTPYGLSGYLVDNNGNIRLMLDRKAQASTIVLAPTMFNALAEMVRKTQEQHNDPNTRT